MAGKIFGYFGSDNGKVRTATKAKLAELVSKEDEEFGLETIDGQAENAEAGETAIGRVITGLRTVPFFGDKVVYFSNVNLLSSNQTASAEGVKLALEHLLDLLEEGLPDNVNLVISGDTLFKSAKAVKRLLKVAKVENFERENTSAVGWGEKLKFEVIKRARKFDLHMDEETAELFALLVGAESSVIDSTLEMLELYKGKGATIDIELIRRLIPLNEAGAIFEISDALLRMDALKAVALIDRQLAMRSEPIALMRATFIPTIRNLFYAKMLHLEYGLPLNRGMAKRIESLPASAQASLPRTKAGKVSAWGIGQAAEHARKFSYEGLRDLLGHCLDADRKLVTTQLDGRMLLHRLVSRLVAAAERGGRKVKSS